MSARAAASPAGGEVDVDAVVSAVSALPEVVSLAAAGVVPVATYLPGRRVAGVRADDHAVTVAVVGALWHPVADVASAVRRAVAPLAGGRRVDVRLEDVAVPAGAPADARGR